MTSTNAEEAHAVSSDIQDPFATGTPEADPFAQTAPAPASAIDPPDDGPDAAEPPIVNREGEPVEGDANGATPVEAQPEAAAPAEAVDATPEEAAAQPEAAETPAQPPAEPQAAPEAAQPPAQPAAQATAPATAASTDGADEAAATPAEGKSPWRHYKLLYQTGPSQWAEFDLSSLAEDMKQYAEQKDGEMFLRARNADHARRIAWVIFGRPEAGVTVNPVARSSWKPKRLSKAPPQPERERLVIS